MLHTFHTIRILIYFLFSANRFARIIIRFAVAQSKRRIPSKNTNFLDILDLTTFFHAAKLLLSSPNAGTGTICSQ
jgi:hypothetical protein